jgi:hypothetical protein
MYIGTQLLAGTIGILLRASPSIPNSPAGSVGRTSVFGGGGT